jgi:hypothetical protein
MINFRAEPYLQIRNLGGGGGAGLEHSRDRRNCENKRDRPPSQPLCSQEQSQPIINGAAHFHPIVSSWLEMPTMRISHIYDVGSTSESRTRTSQVH